MRLHPQVVIVGDRPSKANVDPRVPFVGTRSYKTLLSWIADMNLNIDDITLVNAFLADGRPSGTLYLATFMSDFIITLGDSAFVAVHNLLREHKNTKTAILRLPHPSGLNRATNDKRALRKKLLEISAIIYGGGTK